MRPQEVSRLLTRIARFVSQSYTPTGSPIAHIAMDAVDEAYVRALRAMTTPGGRPGVVDTATSVATNLSARARTVEPHPHAWGFKSTSVQAVTEWLSAKTQSVLQSTTVSVESKSEERTRTGPAPKLQNVKSLQYGMVWTRCIADEMGV